MQLSYRVIAIGLVEELFLQSAEYLNDLRLPVEVVVGYCMACPLRGLFFAQTFIVHREVCSDEDVFDTCALFNSLDLHVSSRVLLSSRGMVLYMFLAPQV